MPETQLSASGNGSKIGWRELYEAIQHQDEKRDAMERRILEALKVLACVDDVKDVKGDVEVLKKTVYGWGGINTALAIIGSTIAAIFGTRN